MDTNNSMSKLNFGHAVMLRADGKNFQSWKCLVPGYLQSSLYAWEATDGQLTPGSTDTEEKEHWKIGNKNARTIFLQIIELNLFLSEFFDDGDIVTSADIWKRMKALKDMQQTIHH